MNKNKESSHWMKILDAYGRYVQYIIFILLFLLSAISTAILKLGIMPFIFPFLSFFIIFVFLGLLTDKVAVEEMHAYDVLRVLKLSSAFNYLSMIWILMSFSLVFIPVFSFVPVIIPEYLSDFLIWTFIFSVILWTYNFPNLIVFIAMSSFLKAKLCFIVAMDCIEKFQNMEKRKRYDSVRKKFVALSKGLSYSARYIGDRFPDHPEIFNIKSYYDYAYLIALDGSQPDLDTLKSNIAKLDKAFRDKNFRQILSALQHLRGKVSSKNASTEELCKLFRTLPSFSVQLIELLKRISPLLTFIATVASVIALYPQIKLLFDG